MQHEQLEAEPGEPPDRKPVLGQDEVREHVVTDHQDIDPVGAFAPELAVESSEFLGREEPRGPDPRLWPAADPEHRDRPAAGHHRPAPSRVAKAGPEYRFRRPPERGPDLTPVRSAKARREVGDVRPDGRDDPGWFETTVQVEHLPVVSGHQPVVAPAKAFPARPTEFSSDALRRNPAPDDTP